MGNKMACMNECSGNGINLSKDQKGKNKKPPQTSEPNRINQGSTYLDDYHKFLTKGDHDRKLAKNIDPHKEPSSSTVFVDHITKLHPDNILSALKHHKNQLEI